MKAWSRWVKAPGKWGEQVRRGRVGGAGIRGGYRKGGRRGMEGGGKRVKVRE